MESLAPHPPKFLIRGNSIYWNHFKNLSYCYKRIIMLLWNSHADRGTFSFSAYTSVNGSDSLLVSICLKMTFYFTRKICLQMMFIINFQRLESFFTCKSIRKMYFSCSYKREIKVVNNLLSNICKEKKIRHLNKSRLHLNAHGKFNFLIALKL